PGESRELVEAELNAILDEASAADPDFSADVRVLAMREPFEIDPASELVGLVSGAATAVLGSPPQIVGVPFWADSALLAAAGIPTVVLGPVGAGLHSEVEWVDVDSLERCVEIYLAGATELCA